MPESDSLPARRPRLLVLASTYPRWPGDSEPGFVHELSKRLTDRFDTTVLCPHAPGAATSEVLDGVSVVRYRYAPERLETLVNDGGIVTNLRLSRWKYLLVPTFVLAQAWRAWWLSRTEDFDVIHAHWLLPQGWVAAGLQYLSGTKVPFVVTSHGADLYALRGGLFARLKRWVVARSASATVVSSAMLENLRDIGANTAKLSVLSMSVDVSGRFIPDASVQRSTEEILFVGRLVEKKGVIHLLNAMPHVLRQRPDVRLCIAGFGPEEPRLRARAESLGIAGRVKFLGAVPQAELPELYQRAALFVAPFVQASSGDQEGLGLVLVEAIGCGCPVLAGNVPAVRDVLGPEAESCMVDPCNEAELARRMLEFLSDPIGARERASRMGLHVRCKFDWDSIADDYSRLLLKATR